MNRFRSFIRDIVYVSRKTGTDNKKLLIFLSVLLSNLTAFADIAIIVLFSRFITNEMKGGSLLNNFLEIMASIPLLLPLLVVLRYIFIYFQSYNLKVLELRVQKNLKKYLLNEVFDKSNYSVADAYFFINTLTGHIAFFYSALTNLINFSIQTLAYLAYLIIADQRTILTFGIGVFILFIPSRYLIIKSREYMHNSYLLEQQSNKEIQKIVDNMFVIKIMNKAKEEVENFSNTLQDYNKNLIKNHMYGSFSSFLPSFITLFIFSILITVLNLSKTITLDFIGVTLRLFQSLGGVAGATNQLINSHVHMEKFYQLETNKDIVNKSNYKYSESNSDLAISIKKVNFKYFNDNKDVFSNLNIDIPQNTHNIIIGENGSGKSTLLGLISGVLYPNSGEINSYKKNFGYIGPTPLIFTESLRYNLVYGNQLKKSDLELIETCKQFQLFKDKPENILDILIDNKSLSSGQMQKIAFMRALLSEPEVLLLDESTSNLDTESKSLIFEILKKRKVTIINCTHDPYSFTSVDNYIKIQIENDKRLVSIKQSI